MIGAGPSGCAAASYLAMHGHRVVIADSAQFPRDKTCGDGISPLAVRMLIRLNVLSQVESEGAFRIENVLIQSPMGKMNRSRFDESLGANEYALAMPRIDLDSILLKYALSSGAEAMLHTRIEEVQTDGDLITSLTAKHLDSNVRVKIQPRHVIFAVGANIGFLRRCGFTVNTQNVSLATRSYYSTSIPLPKDYALYFDEELIPGYGWVFPVANQRANIGIGVVRGRHRATSNIEMLDAFINRRVNQEVLCGVTREDDVKGYPIRSDYGTQRIAGANWMLVGEAAGLVNPLTGEGIDLALYSGILASECLHAGIGLSQPYSRLYEAELSRRFRLLFVGWRICRNLLLRRHIMDRIVHTMSVDSELRSLIVKMGLGLESPISLAHPKWLYRVIRSR